MNHNISNNLILKSWRYNVEITYRGLNPFILTVINIYFIIYKIYLIT